MAEADPFYEQIAPMRDALEQLAQEAGEAATRHGLYPHVGTPGFREIEGEAQYASGWGTTPIVNAYSVARLKLVAADDHIRALCNLLKIDPPPLFAHTVLARAALEATAGSAWLTEPGIGTKRRVARWLMDQIADKRARATLVESTGADEHIEEAARLRAEAAALYDEADRNQFALVRDTNERPIGIEEKRPGLTDLVTDHFTRAGGVMKGDLIYRLFSGIAHAAAHGLRSGYDPVRDGLFPTGMGGAQFRTTGPDVLIVLGVVTLSYVNALDQVAELYGWKDEPWDAARLRALQTGKSHFPTS